jgi:Protein-disulfide isomerase
MKNQKNLKNQTPQKKSSTLPFVIIGVVLIAVVGVVALGTGLIGAGWWLASSNTSSTIGNSAARPNTTATQKPAVTNAPVGAPLGVNMLGSSTAAVTVEEFADYQCGACASTHPVMKELQSAYAGNKNFRFVFRHYPLAIPGHDKSPKAAAATEAAGLQGKFWQMQDLLFRNQAAWSTNPNYLQLWEEYAASIGMDVARFKADMDAPGPRSRVEADMARGRGLGVSSTPTVYINGQMVPFASMNIASLRQAVDAAIQQAASAPAATNSTAPATNK